MVHNFIRILTNIISYGIKESSKQFAYRVLIIYNSTVLRQYIILSAFTFVRHQRLYNIPECIWVFRTNTLTI